MTIDNEKIIKNDIGKKDKKYLFEFIYQTLNKTA
jgi:hypothetical protein